MASSSRTLILDAQLFQSFTFHRGMGKYSLALLEHLAEKLPEYTHKILLFNNISGYLSEDEMKKIKNAARGFSFEFLGFKHLDHPDNYKAVKEYNRGIVDQYIADRLPNEVIDFMILGLFQETEVSVYPTQCARKSVIVYDIIPLQLFDPYLVDERLEQNYLSRYDTLLESDHFFPISQSVATDLTLHLGIPSSRITPVYGAPAKRRHLKTEEVPGLRNTKVILFPSGEDTRKNNEVVVRAFEKFNNAHDHQYTLVITSSFSVSTSTNLKKLSKKVFFTGNVTEPQLAWLYDRAEVVLFLSYAEGLGLPILEAVEFNKKVLCSDIAVFKEMHDSALYFCDPYKQASIVDALSKVIKQENPDPIVYGKILQKYNWENTAQSVAGILRLPSKDKRKPRIKVAVFSPKPSGFSGIGKVVQEQHYELSRSAEVTYFLESGMSEKAQDTEIRKNFLPYVAASADPWSFSEEMRGEFDQLIFHIGNGEYHVATLIKALSFPDTVVLHDTRIRGLYNVVHSHGFISADRYGAEDALNRLVNGKNGDFLVSLVNKQNKLIVHSEYALEAVKSMLVKGSRTTVLLVPLAIPPAYFVQPPVAKQTVYVAMAGVMTQSKGIDLAENITKLRHDDYNFKVKIFGFSMLENEVLEKLERNKSIELIPSPTDTRYLYELEQSDILLNFRHPYHGETSYSTLEGIRFGKLVIVNNTGWFSELPDEIVTKVGNEDEALKAVRSFNAALEPKDQLKRTSYIFNEHSIDRYIQNLISKESKNAKK